MAGYISCMIKRTDYIRLPQNIKRLILLGDPHGDLESLKLVYNLENNSETAFFSMGDNIGYFDGEKSSQLVAFLMEKGILSVFGNHEEWLRPTGELFLPRNTSLTFPAFDWCKNLPLRIRIDSPLAPQLSFTIQHSFYNEGNWDWLSDDNLVDFFKEVPGNIILTGHSHQPKIHLLSSIGKLTNLAHTLTLEDIANQSGLKIKADVKYVLDSGSLSRASHVPRNHGSYGVVDLQQQILNLKIFDKGNASHG